MVVPNFLEWSSYPEQWWWWCNLFGKTSSGASGQDAQLDITLFLTGTLPKTIWTIWSSEGKARSKFSLRKLKAWALSLTVLFNLVGIALSSDGPTTNHANSQTVTTKYGSLRGLRLQFTSSSNKHLDAVSAYLGIPYASPPINAYRFMPPVAPLPWGQGIRLAVSYPPPCPQRFPDISNRTRALETMTLQRFLLLQRLIPHLANQSEDCLYLNFFVPTVPTGEEIRPGRFPILFVITGESWEWGSGNEFDGGILATLGNHIVVTFNYRLGILGFMKTSNQQGNFGLLDVIAALHYVRENGDAFGGDRNRITLLGYKTGAVVANLLLIAQIAKDLFQRAILISGSVLSPWALQRRPEEIALQVSNHLGCKGVLPLNHPESDLAPCLRRKPLSDLLSFVPESPRFLSPFAPYVDNNLLRSPRLMMEGSGSGHPLPGLVSGTPGIFNDQFKRSQLMLIFTSSEGVHELNDREVRHGFEADHRDRLLRTLVRNVFNYHQQEIFSIVRNEYTDWERPILHPIPLRDATVEALGDCLAIAPILQLAMTHSRILDARSTYLLHFAHVSKDVEGTPYERLGSLEGDVVPYAMGLPATSGGPSVAGSPLTLEGPSTSPWSALGNFSKQDAVVSETLIHYLSNFVHSGNIYVSEEWSTIQPIRPFILRFLCSTLPETSHIPVPSYVSFLMDPNSNEFASNEWNVGTGNSREKVRVRSLLWEPFEPNSQIHLNIGVKPKLKNHYRGHKLALWLNLIPQIHVPGGSDVSPGHHTFTDHSSSLYIGPVRQLYPLSFGDQIPGIGTHTYPLVTRGGTSSTTPLTPSSPSTDCIEPSTESSPSFSKGIGLTALDLDEAIGLNLDGLGSRDKGTIPEYDYTTALTVTLTVGVCLILLNLIVFSAIMCHRKRGIGGQLSVSSGSPGSGRLGGTPLKTYNNQEDFKWMSSCSPGHGGLFGSPEREAFGGGEMDGQSGCRIPMNQFSAGEFEGGSTFLRRSSCDMHSHLPPTSMDQNLSPCSGNLHFLKADYCCATQQTVQAQLPNCINHQYHQIPIPGPDEGYSIDIDSGPHVQYGSLPPGASIRLYMNRSATGDEEMQNIEAISTLPRNIPTPLYTNTNSRRRNSDGRRQLCDAGISAVQSPPSSSSGTTSLSTPNTGSNASPNAGNTTLVSALKRHSSGGTPNSTIKKRVQIQEISV